MNVTIYPVESKAQWDHFIDLPWRIYQGDPNWVPPLRIAVRDLLDRKKNPFFKHAEFLPLLAEVDGQVVGRVAGIIDRVHIEKTGEKVSFFGFFESVNQLEVAQALIQAVAEWAQKKGMCELRGPVNPSTNYECGLLIEGFNDSPNVMMTYNPPYYASLLEQLGFSKKKDLLAYDLASERKFSDRIFRHAERLQKKNHVNFRSINMKHFNEEVDRILDIYNDAWESNWGFVPMDPEEFRHMAKDMKMVVDPRLLLIAEYQGEPIGFGLALPDVNQVLKKVRDGRLFPTGLLKLLWNLKGPGRKKTIDRCRILTLGIKKKYQTLGVGALLYAEYFRVLTSLGYHRGEASWILEDNVPMNRALEMMQARRSKVYRIYGKTLS